MNLYIDPGTGSMLFTILLGIIGVLRYFCKSLWLKLKVCFGIKKQQDEDDATMPLVIFSDDKRYWPVFEPVCRELNTRGFDIVYYTSSEDDPALQNLYPHVKASYIGRGNQCFAKLNFLKATILMSTTPGLDVYQWKRSRDVRYYVHLPHAASDLSMYRMFGIDYYDAILISGAYQEEQVRDMEALRGLPPKEITMVGVPYMDEMWKRLQTVSKRKNDRLTVLLAPSWGKSSILQKYGKEFINKLLNTGYRIIIRPHPQSFISEKQLMDKLMDEFPNTENLKWNRDVDNFAVLNEADILISDFSGVMFDFALVFDKPIIYTNNGFDVSPYDAWWLKSPIWTFSVLPKIGEELRADNLEKIKEVIDECLRNEKYSTGRALAREEAWAYRGESAVRVADYIIGKYKDLRKASEGESR